MQTDPNNTYGADSSNVNVQVSGSSNAFTLNQATNAMASTLDLDWTINGSNNSITSSIDQDLATNYMNISGSDNTVLDGDGYQGAYFHLTHTGGSRTINVTQQVHLIMIGSRLLLLVLMVLSASIKTTKALAQVVDIGTVEQVSGYARIERDKNYDAVTDFGIHLTTKHKLKQVKA